MPVQPFVNDSLQRRTNDMPVCACTRCAPSPISQSDASGPQPIRDSARAHSKSLPNFICRLAKIISGHKVAAINVWSLFHSIWFNLSTSKASLPEMLSLPENITSAITSSVSRSRGPNLWKRFVRSLCFLPLRCALPPTNRFLSQLTTTGARMISLFLCLNVFPSIVSEAIRLAFRRLAPSTNSLAALGGKFRVRATTPTLVIPSPVRSVLIDRHAHRLGDFGNRTVPLDPQLTPTLRLVRLLARKTVSVATGFCLAVRRKFTERLQDVTTGTALGRLLVSHDVPFHQKGNSWSGPPAVPIRRDGSFHFNIVTCGLSTA